MFVKAIEKISPIIRPIYGFTRYFNSDEAVPDAATFFFVNDKGYAVTCKHVADMLLHYKSTAQSFETFKKDLTKDIADEKDKIERLKNYVKENFENSNPPIQSEVRFEDSTECQIIAMHPIADLAIIRTNPLHCANNIRPIFKKYSAKVGKMLCRSGYAFPDFDNFRYNPDIDKIEWTTTGKISTSPFHVDGMVARRKGYILIMTTPGYDFMSGAPLYDENGYICGMQTSVLNKYTNFDCDQEEIWHNGIKRKVTQYPFAHFAECLDAEVIKAFLMQNRIEFYEESF